MPNLRRISQDHPRIRGEHENTMYCSPRDSGSSPHTRGALASGRRASPDRGIIPAYAGSTSTDPSGRCELQDHPRIRGEHPSRRTVRARKRGSSPHTRGARSSTTQSFSRRRIIPAYAGSTPRGKFPGGFFQDHPRIRGEHAVFANQVAKTKGSSPHTRGAPWVAQGIQSIQRIIPAYAGSTS